MEHPVAVSAEGGVEVLQFRNRSHGCLSYLLVSAGEAALIDPVSEPSAYLPHALQRRASLRWVLLTHRHDDHEIELVALRAGNWTLCGPGECVPATVGRVLEDGDHLALGAVGLTCMSVPGHTHGSMAFLLGSMAFVGDALRARRTPCEGERHLAPAEAESTAKRLLRGLPNHVQILPGHCCDPHRLSGKSVISARVEELRP